MLTPAHRRLALGCSLMLAIALSVIGDDRTPVAGTPDDGSARHDTRPQAPAALQPTGERDIVAMATIARDPPAAGGVDVFASKSWAGPRAPRTVVEAPAPAPTAPPLPFSYAGRIDGREGPTFLLSREAESFSVHVGEQIDPSYRLESATAEALVIVYLPLGESQTLPVEALQ